MKKQTCLASFYVLALTVQGCSSHAAATQPDPDPAAASAPAAKPAPEAVAPTLVAAVGAQAAAHDNAGCGGEEGEGCAGNCKGGDDPPPVSDDVETVRTDGAPVRGGRAASITIVAFDDFQCPFCAKSEATLRAVEAAHPGDVRIVFKNLPLPFHANARIAAKAAIAADLQGRFWDFHDRVYGRAGSPIDRPALDKIAQDLGLDMTRFARDIDDPATEARIAGDEADAAALKVRGTPTFFVNGRRVIGAQPASALEQAIAKR
jgi:protein-disulfide isomerase